MSRTALIVPVTLALALGASARAELPLAPPPREIRPDGSRAPVPPPDPPISSENPAATVERIIKNSKAVGDKLENKDTGAGTRQTQGKILSDIDALINQQENPPPPQPDQNKDKEKDKDDGTKDKKDAGAPMKGETPMKNDGPMGKDGTDMGPMQKGGTGPGDTQPMGRKPRMGDPMNEPKGEAGDGSKEPNKAEKEKGPEHPKDTKGAKEGDAKRGASPADRKPMDKMPGRPALPFEEEDASKDVWGHLPDKLRQQMSQYYKDEFTPKYAELLKLYYSSLADRTARPGGPMK